MAEQTVGVRDLKARLSAYLREVRKGKVIVITEHGKPIAQLSPRKEDLMERVKALQAAGLVEWSGKRLRRIKPLVVNKSDKQLSDLVVELRE
ncbi:MAG: type II toxin-antitoxin system Phd/YefM family antitoxin [Chloroflexota bacterium]